MGHPGFNWISAHVEIIKNEWAIGISAHYIFSKNDGHKWVLNSFD